MLKFAVGLADKAGMRNNGHSITFPRDCDDARCERCGAHFSTVDLIKVDSGQFRFRCEGDDQAPTRELAVSR